MDLTSCNSGFAIDDEIPYDTVADLMETASMVPIQRYRTQVPYAEVAAGSTAYQKLKF